MVCVSFLDSKTNVLNLSAINFNAGRWYEQNSNSIFFRNFFSKLKRRIQINPLKKGACSNFYILSTNVIFQKVITGLFSVNRDILHGHWNRNSNQIKIAVRVSLPLVPQSSSSQAYTLSTVPLLSYKIFRVF